MTAPRGWGLPESHLLPDVVVAFVDGELSIVAHERAAAHIARCQSCAAEVDAQRQARAAVKLAEAPSMSAGFLASLRSIPENTELPTLPDNLAITANGQLVVLQRPGRVAGLRDSGALVGSTALGSSAPLGNSSTVLGGAMLGGASRFGDVGRRAAQGAGVVVSGLVLSALVLVVTSAYTGAIANDTKPPQNANLLPAQFGAPAAPVTTSQVVPTPVSTPPVPFELTTPPVPAGLVGVR
jgi:anti-sigma factor RsiW